MKKEGNRAVSLLPRIYNQDLACVNSIKLHISDIPPQFFVTLGFLYLECNDKRHRPASFPKASLKASLTVEASVVLPVVVCVLVLVMLFFRILEVHWGVEKAIQETGRNCAIYGELLPDNQSGGGGFLESAAVIGLAEASISGKNVPVRYVDGGQAGINLLLTKVDDRDIDIIATYGIKVPFSMFGDRSFKIVQRARVRRWNGYDPHEDGADEGEYVYVTEHGVAYHRQLDCVYLNPSISPVSSAQVSAERNESGGRYYPCERCGATSASVYYITDYGTVYHSSLACPSLKRDISKITLDEAVEGGKHACSKCG